MAGAPIELNWLSEESRKATRNFIGDIGKNLKILMLAGIFDEINTELLCCNTC